MSGAELCLGVLGAAIPVMQAAIAAIGRLESPTGPRLHARSIAELHSEASQEWFSAIYSNLQLYQEVVEPNVEEQDRAFASNVRTNVYRMVTKSQETIDQLLAASRDQRSRPEDLRALEDKLGEYAKYLNNFQVSLMNRLLLRQFQRLSRDGAIGFIQSPTEGSEISESTLRPDIEPIRVSLTSPLAEELARPVSRGDIALLQGMFDTQGSNTEPTSRPSLALLLACREHRPQVVKLCLDYSADPTVTDDDGLGAIHNAIGTADVMGEPSETIEILDMLIKQGVEASARDSTTAQLRPLHRAAMTKNVSATMFLLGKDPDMVNLGDVEGKTALLHACSTPSQKMALVEELVHKKANFGGMGRPQMPDHDGQAIARYLDEQGIE